MSSLSTHAHLAPSLSTHDFEYSRVPSPRSTISPLLDGPAFPVTESERHKEPEPARTSLVRRAWRRFKTFNWRTDLGAIAIALGFGALVLALGVLTCFGLNVVSTYVGARILHYTTPIRTIFHHTVVAPAYARVAFTGCAIVNAALLLLAPAVTILVESRHGGDAAAIAWWITLALGMLVGSATVASLGIVVVPAERAPEGLSAIHALAAGSLGTVVVGIPVFVLGVLYTIGSSS
ncbi:hypothetical protein LXA43DRAFT_975767 [Ganoderma leucocontextum]|nr:hypothetical protein LXA43DRAFT_975767 [Ganoderma leucocontextum]